MMAFTLLFLNGCTSESIIARDQLYGYLSSKSFSVDIYSDDVESFDNERFGGFSNYGYADEDHLELRYLKDSVYTEVIYYYDYQEDDQGQIDLRINSVEINYKNIDENEYLKIVKTGIDDYHQLDEKSYDAFIISLYELRMIDVVWVLTSLGYQVK